MVRVRQERSFAPMDTWVLLPKHQAAHVAATKKNSVLL
jgi:hypothetical protein